MQTITVEVQQDFLERVAATSPVLAIVELIWNGLDADASQIRVEFVENSLSIISQIMIKDNGDGIPFDEAEQCFRGLGGSRKRSRLRSRTKKRILHGKAGKGRFKAFSLGSLVEWHTHSEIDGQEHEYRIVGNQAAMKTFVIHDPVPISDSEVGTTVVISNTGRDLGVLKTESARQEIAEHLALYLEANPDLRIYYDDIVIDPRATQVCKQEFGLEVQLPTSQQSLSVPMTVIEWKHTTERALYFCTEDGFARLRTLPEIQAPGFHFTAYLKHSRFSDMSDDKSLLLEEMSPDIQEIKESARKKLKSYFRERRANQSRGVVEEWKKDGIYPYEGSANNSVEIVRRQVFDVVAVSVKEYLPDFDESETKSQKFTLYMLKQAIEHSPEEAQRIIKDVLQLPQKKQQELARLLDRTSLAAIINTVTIIANRLDFLKGLETLVYDYKNVLKERSQLQKIVERETWIFGEEFHLSVPDKSLNTVLTKYLSLLEKKRSEMAPVKVPGKASAIVDLMLGRQMSSADGPLNLVVELKRPKQVVDNNVLNQVQQYALAVANDDRFHPSKTKWVFWAVSNEIEPMAMQRARMRDKPAGLVWDSAEQNVSVWAKTWSEIIHDCRARMHFYQDQLKYVADDDSSAEYIRALHGRYLPSEFPTGE